jgi:hypothetical protein
MASMTAGFLRVPSRTMLLTSSSLVRPLLRQAIVATVDWETRANSVARREKAPHVLLSPIHSLPEGPGIPAFRSREMIF